MSNDDFNMILNIEMGEGGRGGELNPQFFFGKAAKRHCQDFCRGLPRLRPRPHEDDCKRKR